ncbi:hypothetical protein M758_5G008900 [Ceratodon purpureus]|nr:hypothetical protein M758_5G008900 [Ceratodon purpureus]
MGLDNAPLVELVCVILLQEHFFAEFVTLALAGSVPCIVVSTAEVARELFQTHDANFSSRPRRLVWRVLHNYDDNFKVMGSAPYGPYWRNLRKFFNEEMFSPKCLAAREGIRMEEIQHMTAILLDDAQQGRVVNLKRWLWGVTSNTITRIFCNRRFYGPDQNEQDREEFEQMTAGILSALGAFVISDYIPSLSFIARLQGWEKKFESVYALSTRISEKMFEVEKHRERVLKGRESGQIDMNYVPDFVDVFLTKPLEGGKLFPDEDIILFLKHMLNAGTDTSATMVEWTMAELIRKPDIMKRAQEELDAVVGSRQFVQESDFAHLPFLEAIVKEGFRVHPPSPLPIIRESLQPCEFRGYKLPAKTLLLNNIFAIHRDPAVYEDPDEFRPERFLDRPEINHLAHFSSFELIPFGVGRRMCPGSTLGHVMVMLMLGNLLFRFQWSMPEGLKVEDIDMSEAGGLTMWMKSPLCLVATPRTPLSKP